MKFSALSQYLERLEATSSRLEITDILADLFKKAESDEIDKIVYLVLGRLAPSYESIVFNIAERMMLASIASAYKKDLDEVKRIYKQKGDLGKVAQSLSTSKDSGLSVSGVYDELVRIAKDEGEGTVERKVAGIGKLLSDLDSLSARFVARIPVGRLRLGFSDKTILDALSVMMNGDKSAKTELDRAYQVTPDVGALAKNVKKLGLKKAVSAASPVTGIPVLPMLAQRLKSPDDMIKKMGEVAIEPKLDGLRIQIHLKKGQEPKSFTRNLNETSWMFPELKKLDKYIKANEVILDSEAVGVDEVAKKLANFQTTMTRRRKHGVDETASKVPIKFYVFDILLKNGKGLMDKTYIERRKELERTITKSKLVEMVDFKLSTDAGEISSLNDKYHKEGLEGIIVKKADGKYVPGRTGWRWVKMKEAEEAHAKLADTVDCVVMGYSAGKGKRTSFGIGQFLAGVRDKEEIKTITKVGTGLTDDQFRELKERLSKLEVSKKPKEFLVHKNLEPDFWVTPKLVIELAADEVTKSPNHSAGMALRFPRLIKFRDDKSASQATTLTEIKKLFNLQTS